MAEEYLTDEKYLERVNSRLIQNIDNRSDNEDFDDAYIKLRQEMYFPIDLSLPFNSLNELIEKYDEEQNNTSDTIGIVQTCGDTDDKVLSLTKDDSSFFSSQPIRKIIFAPPGCSKTRFTRRLALQLAQKNDTGMFPFYLPCYLLNKANDKKEDLIDLAYKMQVIMIGEKNFDEIINRHADNGLLIIDGLDESSEDDRKLIAKSLKNFLGEHQNFGFVITARLRQYDKDELVDVSNTQYHYIKKLDDRAVFSFIREWSRLFRSIRGEAAETDDADVRRITDIISFVNNRCDDNIRSFVRIPMHLSNMLNMREDDCEDFPCSIDQYYNKYLNLTMRGVSSDAKFYKKVVAYTAYWMSCCPHKRYVSIDKKTLTDRVLRSKMSSKKMRGIDRKPVEEILDTLVNKMSVLTQVSLDRGDEYRFEHLTLQELLTAKALMSEETTDFDGYIRKDCSAVDFIRRVTYDNSWKEYDQIIKFILQLSDLKEEEREEIEYLLKKKGIYDSVNTL